MNELERLVADDLVEDAVAFLTRMRRKYQRGLPESNDDILRLITMAESFVSRNYLTGWVFTENDKQFHWISENLRSLCGNVIYTGYLHDPRTTPKIADCPVCRHQLELKAADE